MLLRRPPYPYLATALRKVLLKKEQIPAAQIAGMTPAARRAPCRVRLGWEIAMEAGPQVSFVRDGSGLHIFIGGRWRLGDSLPDEAAELPAIAAERDCPSVHCVVHGLESWDSSLLSLLVNIELAARARSLPVSYDGLPAGLRRLLDMAFAVPPATGSEKKASEDGAFLHLGGQVLAIPGTLRKLLDFTGSLALSFGRLFRGKSDMNAGDLFDAALECGLRALPIVMLTATLFGTILAFMGAVQLVQFGAQIYVAGLVGIAMLRVMGAVLVGVVMAGRTGAAYAAGIGTMQVNEEVDALVTFGISPMDYLVLPRVLALAFMVPLLTLYADLMGILGGFLVAVFMLDLPAQAYYHATLDTVSLRHLFVGLTYGAAFGIIVGFCGCYQGLRCGRSAEAVGRAATSAVVHSIVWIITATAVITVICNILNV